MIAPATLSDANPKERPALEIKSISKSFAETKALQNIDLTIASGEFTALIGPSGSGKSTLLKLCNGLVASDRVQESQITLHGETIQANGRLSPAIRTLRSRIGFIFQSFNLVGRLSLYKNVLIGASSRTATWRNLLQLFPEADKQKAMQSPQKVGLADKAGQRAGTLSGGQQQRGAIARAITQGAQLVLADEPVASLDPRSAQSVMTALAQLADQGVTVVVSLHQIDLAKQYSKRIVALNQGRIHFDGTPENLDSDKLRSIYGDSDECETSAPQLPISSNPEEALAPT